jgi:gluconokinase
VLLGLHALGQLPDLSSAADLVRVQEPVQPDPRAAAAYRRLRPLVERSTLALADVFTELQAPEPTAQEDPRA